MSKDPAVLFYTGDFLNGCSDLTMEERGQYITLLCLQHQKGHLSKKAIGIAIGLPIGSISVDVMKKFTQDENGNFYNDRMEEEIIKRSHFIESKIINGKKGGRGVKATAKPIAKPTVKLPENENEDINNIEKGVENLNCPDNYKPLVKKWAMYKYLKGDIFNPVVLEEFSRQLFRMSKNNLDDASEIVTQSIASNYNSIFELKNKKQIVGKEDEMVNYTWSKML